MLAQIFILFSAGLLMVHCHNLSPTANKSFEIPKNQRIFMKQWRSSYFGFVVNLRSDGIMVSAPRAQTTLEIQSMINETGAIYKCPFDGETCAPFIFDKHGDVDTTNKNGMYRSRKKDHQFLGMSMDGKGGAADKFVVCSPKLITPANNDYYLHGLCYVSLHGTAGDKLSQIPVEIAPLQRTTMQHHRDKFIYVYAEMGIDVHVTEDNNEILIGAPGVYNWKGTVVRYRPIVDENHESGLSRRDTYHRRRSIDHSREIEYEADVPQPELWNQTDQSYFGFAVTSGYFGGPSERMLYAASAPQSGIAGEVYVFDIVDDSHLPGLKVIKKLAILSGEQMGEYFGYTILAEDCNGDGYTDLIIGAPSHSFDGYHEQGAVYYYQNLCGHFDFKLKARLSGIDNQESDSRFGMSLGRIGDLDRDGFNDLAVGAPFENQGAVYIFSGGPEGLRPTPVQKIINPQLADGTSTNEKQPMFGLSISRGLDIDGNGFNDIAIGVPNSEKVLLYKSYPVVRVVASILTDKSKLAQTDNQVNVNVCVHLKPNLKNIKAATTLRLKLKLDTQFRRAMFQSDKTNERIWEIQVNETRFCKKFQLSIRFNIEFIFWPLDLELHYENVNIPSASSPSESYFCDTCIVLGNNATFVTTKLFYMSGCTEKCVADLKITSKALTVVNPFVMGSYRTISYQYTVENLNELAYLPQIRIIKPNQLLFAKIPSNCQTQHEESLLCNITRTYLAKKVSKTIVITFDTVNMNGSELRIIANVSSFSGELNIDDNMVTDVVEVIEFSKIESTGLAAPHLVSLDFLDDFANIDHSIKLRNQGPSTINLMTIIVNIPMSFEADFGLRRQLINFNKITAKTQYKGRDLAISWTGLDRLGFPDIKYQQKQDIISQRVIPRRRNIESSSKTITYNIYTRVSKVDTSPRNLKNSYNDALSNRSLTFNGNDCIIRHQCVQLEVTVSNFRPSQSADVIIDISVEIDPIQVAKLFNERRDTLLYRLGLRLKKDNDDTGLTINHQSRLPYTIIVKKISAEPPPASIYIGAGLSGILILILLTYGLSRCGFFRRKKRDELKRLIRESNIEAIETDEDHIL